MLKSQEIHTLLKSIAITRLKSNDSKGLLALCRVNSMTPLELFAGFISLESLEIVGEMGE